ncbi:cilia- and flagella-associated protein 54 [Lampris incognitus]|uniref:cilia- and flagella-associated protein 54 n=1 Tax=Lampris incognitus TaxID=2546036 RepID=UPI0024B58E60|nr:cilia- and flagella-associated protein 54 [Lampris incognitus]
MDLPASYYGETDRRNPVLSTFEREINSFQTLMKRISSSPKPDNNSHARGVKILMEIWIKYRHRIPLQVYQEHMLRIADFLFGIKLYHLALWQGYSLCLQLFSPLTIYDIMGVDHFMSSYFPDGFDTNQDMLNMKLRALQGFILCVYEQEKKHDILSQEGLCKLLCVLDFIRIMMRAFQRHEHLCWQIYNGSLNIYNICRYLMTMNCSAQALEYLLWASISLELSVPLMTAKYLPWRATLCCAVCQCYYDNQAAVKAEVFAKRALGKLNDLAKMEEQSGIPAIEIRRAHKEATIKLAAMVFKRAVYEGRRRPEHVFRTEPRGILKDLPNVLCPRSATERVLMELFDSSAARFLGIIEALWDSTRRPLQTGMPDKPELQEVVLELVSAGISILSGVAIAGERGHDDFLPTCLSALTSSSTLMELATAGDHKLSFMSVVRFIKLLFNYERWDIFTALTQHMLQMLTGVEGESFRKAELELALLDSFVSLQSSQKIGHRVDSMVNEKEKSGMLLTDEFIGLLDTLHKSVCGSAPEVQPDRDLVLDIILFLWCKMKDVFQRVQSQHWDSKHYLGKLEQCNKWVWCLSALCEVAFAFDLVTIDYIVMAEMTLRLVMLLEMVADTKKDTNTKTHNTVGDAQNGKEVDQNEEEEQKIKVAAEVKNPSPSLSSSLPLAVTDVQLELINIYHRASLKLLQLNPVLTESELLDRIKKNKASKALFLTQKALLMHNNSEPNSISSTKRLLEEAMALIEKAWVEERRLYCSTAHPNETPPAKTKYWRKEEKDKPPPPPVLLFRNNRSLTFAPASYQLEGQVCWYQICGRVAEGINLKVRMGDCCLPGTGNLVPAVAGQCKLRVEGLEPNQMYVFAVAAYNSQGKLVGNTIGETTYPILAFIPLPLHTTWALLAQAAFQTEQYAIAKKACGELWSHFTYPKHESPTTQDCLALTGLHVQTLQHSSPPLLQLFLTSIFIETAINIQQDVLCCDSASENEPFIWGQEARLEECERMLVAVDLAMWLNNSTGVLQGAVGCYGLLAPLIFHQITCDPIAQVLIKCLVALEENSAVLKQKYSGDTSESLMHMIACITYYLSKALPVLGEICMASLVMDKGCKLLQEVYEAQLQCIKPTDETERELTSQEGSVNIYFIIANSSLKSAYKDVMKSRQKLYFIEFAALLLQRAMEENQLHLVIRWGEKIFACLCREMQAVENMLKLMSSLMRCYQHRLQLRRIRWKEGLWRSQLNHIMAQAHIAVLHRGLDKLHGPLVQYRYSQFDPLFFSLVRSGVLMPWIRPQQQQSSEPDAISLSLINSPLSGHTNKEREEVKNLEVSDTVESSGVRENANETETNAPDISTPAMHPTALLLDSLDEAALHLRRSMVLAHRGSHWNTLQSVCQTLWDQGCRIVTLVERGARMGSPSSITVDQLHTILTPLLVLATDLLMDMLDRLGLWSVYNNDVSDEDLEARLHFSGPLDDGTWVDLHWVQTLVLYTLELLHFRAKWETLAHFALLFNSYTRERYILMVNPLLVHAQQRLLDRISSFGGPPVPQPHHTKMQRVTGEEVTNRSYAGHQLLSGWAPPPNASSSLNSTTPGDTDSHHNPQWKNHTNLGIDEHHGVYTCLWICAYVFHICGAEKQRSMSLVCVPLDVEDTLQCYHKALEGRQLYLRTFQHSQSLLQLLLAHTQLSSEVQFNHGSIAVQSSHQVEISPMVTSALVFQPQYLMEEDYSTPKALYSFPISPNYINNVITAYSTSIKCLQANRHDSLRVQVLHDMGNMQFYNGNTRAAHSYWCKALDCALLSSGVFEKWDGVSWGSASPQQTLKLAGIWGCLQAAVLTAKIAQYVLTSDISQRTKCCLLSAHLFKCLLYSSLPHPLSDLHYASYSIEDELLPGVDMFSETHRAHLGTTVTSLNFLCYWLYTAGHYIKLLPLVALYLHFVGTVCRDIQRTVEAKILKMRALTELSLFAEALKELSDITQGKGVFLHHGYHIHVSKPQPVRTFYSNKPLLENFQALEDLVNCVLAPEVHLLYGSTLCWRFNLARVQLVLALSSTIHTLPLAEAHFADAHNNITETSASSMHHEQDNPESECSLKREDLKKLILDPTKEELTPEKLKFLLLERAFHLLISSSQKPLPQSHSQTEELELTIEGNLLMANLYLQQGRSAISSDIAVSSLVLLQMSDISMKGIPSSSQRDASSLLPQDRTTCEQMAVEAKLQSTYFGAGSQVPADVLEVYCDGVVIYILKLHNGGGSRDSCSVCSLLPGDSPREVEARERIGVTLWLKCRLALVHSLVAHIPGTAIIPGKNSYEETVQVLSEGLEECKLWGDPDTQALLLLEGTALDKHRGQTVVGWISVLQETVNLLLDRECMPPGSGLTLAQATLLLSELRGAHNSTLLEHKTLDPLVTQKLLQQQLQAFDLDVVVEDGNVCLPPTGLSNIYLPHLPLLAKVTMHIALKAMERVISTLESTPRHSSFHSSSHTEADFQVPGCYSNSPDPKQLPFLSPFEIPRVAPSSDMVQAWQYIHEVLQSAVYLSQSCAYRDMQLEADLLYFHGIVKRNLRYLSNFDRQDVTETFLECIQTTMKHCHNLLLCDYMLSLLLWVCVCLSVLHKCYLEVALLFLHDWQHTPQKPPVHPAQQKNSQWKRLLTNMNRGLTAMEGYLLLFWVCLRGAAMVSKAISGCAQLSGDRGGVLSEKALDAIPDFATNDLLNVCGGVQQLSKDLACLEVEHSFRDGSRKRSQLTWTHLARYYTHLLNLQQIATKPVCAQTVEGLASLSGVSLALRLSQLHSFFCSHMTNYRENCYPPEPAPAEIMLLPQIMQLSPTLRASLGQVDEMYQWSISTKQQLCIQWHHQPASGYQDMVILLYGLNKHPVSAMGGSAIAVKGLQCGHHMIRMLKKKILGCCLSIKELVQPGSKSDHLTEVPFEISLENISDLECCFNPAGGAIVDGSALTDWILSVLINS